MANIVDERGGNELKIQYHYLLFQGWKIVVVVFLDNLEQIYLDGGKILS